MHSFRISIALKLGNCLIQQFVILNYRASFFYCNKLVIILKIRFASCIHWNAIKKCQLKYNCLLFVFSVISVVKKPSLSEAVLFIFSPQSYRKHKEKETQMSIRS